MIFNTGLWGKLIKQKYLKRLSVAVSLRNQVNVKCRGSLIWRSMLKVLYIINHFISWFEGRGTQVFVGIDPTMGLNNNFMLSHDIIVVLYWNNIQVLKQALGAHFDGVPFWF